MTDARVNPEIRQDRSKNGYGQLAESHPLRHRQLADRPGLFQPLATSPCKDTVQALLNLKSRAGRMSFWPREGLFGLTRAR